MLRPLVEAENDDLWVAHCDRCGILFGPGTHAQMDRVRDLHASLRDAHPSERETIHQAMEAE